MELSFNTQGDILRKHVFNLKPPKNNGLILQIQHSYSDLVGLKRHRFIHSTFNTKGSHLAVSDHKSHIFIVNLETERYWQLPQTGVPTIISFPVLKNQVLLIGLDNTSIIFTHIETGNVVGVLNGHSVPATDVSYSDDGYYYLTSCSAEAIIWDSSTCTQVHRLSLKLEVSLKKVLFMPVTNHILACFQDDTMHVWTFKSFECIKQIVPETCKTHHLKAIAFTKNGKTMVLGGQNSNLVIFCLESWRIKTVYPLPETISGVKQLEFLSQVFDGGSNKILIMLTISHELLFFDIESMMFLKLIKQTNELTARFSITSNGKILASILTTGEINIYSIEKMMSNKVPTAESKEELISNQSLPIRNYSSASKRTQKSNESLGNIQKKIKDVLNVKKLLPILKQFGEYPQSYRTLIWKALLNLPENQESFLSLSLKKCHPSYVNLESKFPLANKSLESSLKRLLSNLSHWCPLFGEVDFLPEFAFPFVKLFHSNPLVCFEVVATIIVNWCQNWFEFYPFPPINMLSLLESVLGYHNPDLLEFYLLHNVTSSITICPLLHTAFSEVLSKNEWLKLWDHVLSNEPSFLFMAIIAYNVVCQNAIKNLHGLGEIKKFFHTQNPVDMKMLISKAYYYLKNTPKDIHTRQFFSPFCPLGSGGSYAAFLAYPKLIIDSSTEKLQCIRKEQERIFDEQMEALNRKKILEESLIPESEEHKVTIYEELEEKIRKTIEEEEDRLLIERQKLESLRQELKLKEIEILKNTRDKVLDEKIRQKEKEFDRLLKDISKRKRREKIEVDVIQKEIKNYYCDLLLRKCQLEFQLGCPNSMGFFEENPAPRRKHKSNDFTELQCKWEELCNSSKDIDLRSKITALKGFICDVEMELVKEMSERNFQAHLKEEKNYIEELKKKVYSLEDEIEMLTLGQLKQMQETENKSDCVSQNNSKSTMKKETKAKKDKKNNCALTGRLPANSGNKKYLAELSKENLEHFEKNQNSKSTKRHLNPQMKSIFTCPSEPEAYSDYPEGSGENTEEEPKHHERRGGDHLSQGDHFSKEQFIIGSKCSKHYKEDYENPSQIKMKKGVFLSDSEDEIFKSALKARNQIVQKAKKNQTFQ